MKTIDRNGHTITFDEDLALRWIEALESGTYKQGRGLLRDSEDRLCCLGVACDVFDPNRWTAPDVLGVRCWKKSRTALPDEIAEQLAIAMSGEFVERKTKDGKVFWGKWEIAGKVETFLTNLNDHGVSFLDIAAALRDYYGFPPRETAVAA